MRVFLGCEGFVGVRADEIVRFLRLFNVGFIPSCWVDHHEAQDFAVVQCSDLDQVNRVIEMCRGKFRRKDDQEFEIVFRLWNDKPRRN